MTRLVDHIKQETGADYPQILLLRHSTRNIDRMLELGSTVEENTAVQPTGGKYDYWAAGKPRIDVVVVIVHNLVHGVYRILGIEEEGTMGSLGSDSHRAFNIERGEDLDIPARRFELSEFPSAAVGAPVTGWEGSQRTPVMRSNGIRFRAIEVELLDDGGPQFEVESVAAQAGAGFGDTAENKLVEEAAVQAVTKDYERDGWSVRSVERDKCGFDLECLKDGKIKHVEVKGVRGTEQSFIITSGEVRQAETNPNFVLAVVTAALSTSPKLSKHSGAEFGRSFDLSAIQYRAVLKP